ncbi:MAG: DUF512 domain-containing protein [bacterium]
MPLKITSVGKKSIFKKYSVSEGDSILKVNHREVFDYFGVMDELERGSMLFEIKKKKNEIVLINVGKENYNRIDCEFEEMKMMRCSNKCIFCFIDQNPLHLRCPLYFKDDDYRESLSYGNFITLSNLNERMLLNISEHKLSPLYISLHAVENNLRKKIFGRENPLEKIVFLLERKVRMHFQIVLMKNVNDGKHLEKTLKFAKKYNALSTGIVPVGLTKYRTSLPKLLPIGKEYSEKLICRIERWKEDNLFKKVYLSDEFYMKAGFDVPLRGYYKGFPQIENGIGMVRLFEDGVKSFKSRRLKKNKAILTGSSFAEYLRRKRYFGGERIYTAKNTFFGENITVCGLLTGKDILNAMENIRESDIILYKSIFNSDKLTLDGYDLKRLCRESGKKIFVLQSNEEIKEYLE